MITYDQCWRDGIVVRLIARDVPVPFVELIESMFVHVTRSVRSGDGMLSAPFPIASGVPQGAVLSPAL